MQAVLFLSALLILQSKQNIPYLRLEITFDLNPKWSDEDPSNLQDEELLISQTEVLFTAYEWSLTLNSASVAVRPTFQPGLQLVVEFPQSK